METYGLDHIARAAGTVLQHETDWNIDIEKEDDTPTMKLEEEEEEQLEPEDQGRQRSVSAAPTKRGPRGPYKKQGQSSTGTNQVAEAVDAEGRLPGSKDGLGAFPADSDWAKMMLALKLKGESMNDLLNSTNTSAGKKYKTKKERLKVEREGPPTLADGSLDYTEMEDPFTVLQNLVPDPPTRPSLTPLYPPLFINETLSYPTATTVPPSHVPPTVGSQMRHWTIARNIHARKVKEKDEEAELPENPSWRVPREAQPIDFGSYAVLAGELAEEMKRRGMVPCTVQEGQEQEAHLDLIREQLEPAAAPAPIRTSYWTREKAAEGDSYLRDMVYGGVDGYAYVRSLAEFLRFDEPVGPEPALGIPLAEWVEKNVVEPLTGGRHRLIKETAEAKPGDESTPVAKQVTMSRNVYPAASAALSTLRSIGTHKIDMAALIKTPDELFLSEEEWHGKELKEKRKQQGVKAEKVEDAMEVEEPEPSLVSATTDEMEGPEELKEVLDYVAAVIIDINKRNASGDSALKKWTEESGEEKEEDFVLRNLRLNLLALAKRAPLDTIAMLPKEMVPESIRPYVSNLGPST